MEVELTSIDGVLKITPKAFSDERGVFYESWRKEDYKKLGMLEDFVQDNISFSRKNVIRGLHFQREDSAQGQLVTIISGLVFDVCVDIRPMSKTFGQYVVFELNSAYPTQIYMPPGIAHGFCVLSKTAMLHYKCTKYFSPIHDCGLLWNDPHIGIEWPILKPIISIKDLNNISFKAFKESL